VPELEVIVVVDGPDAPTVDALAAVGDPRLRVKALASRTGPGGARNAGVDEARAEWVAFLDDDDRWEPRKLGLQLAAARSSPLAFPIVATRITARGGAGDAVWPRRLPPPGEPLSEYLFTRRGLFWGEGLVHLSTVMTRRELFKRTRFDPALKKHEDWSWLLRAVTVEGAGLAFVPAREPLAVWSVDEDRPRASTRPDWRFSLACIRAAREGVTPRAYASFVLTIAGAEAAQQRSARGFLRLAWEALRRGRPRVRDLALYLGIWLVPRRLRQRLAAL
jgi:glycosyltransferase involved in cell wall biosynthesis